MAGSSPAKGIFGCYGSLQTIGAPQPDSRAIKSGHDDWRRPARGEPQASMVAAILAAMSARHSSIGLKPGLARQMASVSR